MSASVGLHVYVPGEIGGPGRDDFRELQATVRVAGGWTGRELPEQ